MDHDGERHAGRGLQEHGLVLDPVGAEDEICERFVGDDRLAGMAGLRQVDDCGRVFGRGVLVAREDEVQEQAGRRVAPQRPALGRVDQALPVAHEIVGQSARVLEKCVGLDVDDLEVGRLNAADNDANEKAAAAARSAPMIPPART